MQLKPEEYNVIDFDSIEASEKAREIMRTKICLRDIYTDMYRRMMKARERYCVSGGKVLEIGSGGGFIKDLFPEVITSDVKKLSGIDVVINAERLPFDDASLDALLAVFVIHHIPDISKFITEALRVLKPGGGIICIETYWGPLARFLYKNVHPEPFNENASDWLVRGDTPMTSSNQALSYLLLKRDKKEFERKFPSLKTVYRKRINFLRYLLTGGIWLKPKVPQFMFPILKALEFLMTPFMAIFAIHHIFVWKKLPKKGN